MNIGHDPSCPKSNDPYNQKACTCQTVISLTTKKARSKKRVFIISMCVLTIFVLVFGIYLMFPENRTDICIRTSFNFCGNGKGIYPVAVDGTVFNTGIIDEHSGTVFAIDEDENRIENLIFEENRKANGGEHVSLIIATTLSKTIKDKGQSRSVGLEELRGAYIKQKLYNEEHPERKLRLIIANLGAKYSAGKTVPGVIRQIALYIKHAPKSDNIIGVMGFPFSDTMKPALKGIHAYGLPVVSSTSSSDDFNNELPEFHRIIAANSAQTPALVRFIKEELDPTSVYVLIDQADSYTRSLGDEIDRGFDNEKINKRVRRFTNPSEFDSALEEISGSNTSHIFFSGFPNELHILKSKMIKQGIALPIVGGAALYEVGGYHEDSDIYANLFFSAAAFPDAKEDGPREFQENYGNILDPEGQCRGKYGCGRSSAHAASSYDGVEAFLIALEKHLSDNITSANIKEALTKVYFNGATGYIKFNSQNSNPGTKQVYILCTDGDAKTHQIFKYDSDGSVHTSESISVCY